MRIHVTDADFRLCIQLSPELFPLIYFQGFNDKLLTVPRLYFCCVSLLPVFDATFFDVSTYVCTGNVATFWERAAHSVDRLFFLYYVYVMLVFARFGFEDRTDSGSDCDGSWSLLTLYFLHT